jgi:hypothetical protein
LRTPGTAALPAVNASYSWNYGNQEKNFMISGNRYASHYKTLQVYATQCKTRQDKRAQKKPRAMGSPRALMVVWIRAASVPQSLVKRVCLYEMAHELFLFQALFLRGLECGGLLGYGHQRLV